MCSSFPEDVGAIGSGTTDNPQSMSDFVVIEKGETCPSVRSEHHISHDAEDQPFKHEASLRQIGTRRPLKVNLDSDTDIASTTDLQPDSSGKYNDSNVTGERTGSLKKTANEAEPIDLQDHRRFYIEERVRNLEREIRKMEHRAPSPDGKDEKSTREQSTTVPKLQRVRWAEFKNKSVDEKNTYAVEVLIGEPKYYDESDSNRDQARKIALVAKHGLIDSLDKSHCYRQEAPEITPQRVRVNSLPVVSILSDITSEDFPTEPLVILHPFKLLVYHENEIRKTLVDLEMKLAGIERQGDPDAVLKRASEYPYPVLPQDTANGQDAKNTSNIMESPGPVVKQCPGSDDGGPVQFSDPSKNTSQFKDPKTSLEALRGLRCLTRFMDEEITPVLERFRSDTCRTVRFADLWYLFKPGEEVFALSGSQRPEDQIHRQYRAEGDPENDHPGYHYIKRYQIAWRVFHATNGRRNLSEIHGETPPAHPKERLEEKVNDFAVRCYYIDYWKERVGPSTCAFNIYPFEGEKEITSLEIFPSRFAVNAGELRDKLHKRGALFQELIATKKHRYFSGWTLDNHPSGDIIQGKSIPNPPKFMESEVVVDFEEVLRIHPNWCLWYGPVLPSASALEECREDFPISSWKGPDHKRPAFLVDEIIHADHHVDTKMMTDFILKEPILNLDKAFKHHSQLDDSALRLLPARVLAFAVRTHEFGKCPQAQYRVVFWICS